MRRFVIYQLLRATARLALTLLCVLAGHPSWAQDPLPAGADPGSEVALRGVVIPTGFQNGKYSAMIQVAVDGSPLPGATWDLEASFAIGTRSPEEFSGHVETGEPDTPAVLEAQVEFEPGPYVLTLAARETTAGQSGTRKLEGHWPDPGQWSATVSPVALLQPAQGAFLRGGNSRGQGALAIGKDDQVRAQLPTAVVSVVCRGAALTDLLRIERKLEGALSVDFKAIDLPPGPDQCAQVRDIIVPGTLGQGYFRYEVRVMRASDEIASGVREFSTVVDAQWNRPGS